jgi:hypothetical protein
MIELILFIIFILSLAGVIFIVYKKIPAVSTLPKNGSAGIREHHIISGIEKKVKDILVAFDKQIWLHKILSWIKIITLKLEVKIDHLLHGIRKNAQKIDKERKNKKI